MSRLTPITLGLALPFSLLAQAALADLTPQQVWGDWRSYMEGMGYEISAAEETSGDTLSVNGLTMRFPLPENEGDVTVAIDTIAFEQLNDGNVAIVLPDVMPFLVTGKGGPTGDQDMNMRLSFTQSGQSMTASGSPEAITYVMGAPSFGMSLDEMMVGGVDMTANNTRFNLSGTNLATTTSLTLGDTRGYTQNGSIESLSYDIFAKSNEGDEGQGAIKGTIGGVTMTGEGTLPLSVTAGADMAEMFAQGFDVTGNIAFGQGNSSFDIQDPQSGNYVMTTSSSGGAFGVKMGAAGLGYDVSQTGLNVAVTVEGMPFPFEVAMKESGFNLAMPVSKSEDPQDFALGIKMADLTMSDMIWSIFDPQGQLPRDPATVLLDLSGKAKLLVDWMNPEEIGLGGNPGEVQKITLGTLLIDAAGAKLEGDGDVAFDGAASGIIPGMGNPVGAVNIALAGGNGLLDTLVNMGLLPQDQAMGARMMMGLFAVPGDAPDTLKSKIEFTQDGQVLANGQRIR